jgi:diadenosine tetraphosphate (Ap4A) HIT family hydrolase
MKASCTFCQDEVAGEMLFEDEHCRVILHEDWAVRGHAMVVWKRHVENVSDLTEEEAVHFSRVHHTAERILLEETRTERAVLLKLGIVTPHLHLHIYPVAAALGREAVFAIMEARTREPRDEAFVGRLRCLFS